MFPLEKSLPPHTHTPCHGPHQLNQGNQTIELFFDFFSPKPDTKIMKSFFLPNNLHTVEPRKWWETDKLKNNHFEKCQFPAFVLQTRGFQNPIF